MRLQNGFTLIELMITITIMGILMSIAAPSFQSVILGARLSSTSNAMVSALQLARSEAIKQHKTVIVEPLNGNWQNGWRVFVDVTGNGTYDSATDTLLTSFDAMSSTVAVKPNPGVSISYNSTGRLPSGVSNNVVFCSNSSDNSDFRAVVISLTGRVHVETSSNASQTYACP